MNRYQLTVTHHSNPTRAHLTVVAHSEEAACQTARDLGYTAPMIETSSPSSEKLQALAVDVASLYLQAVASRGPSLTAEAFVLLCGNVIEDATDAELRSAMVLAGLTGDVVIAPPVAEAIRAQVTLDDAAGRARR